MTEPGGAGELEARFGPLARELEARACLAGTCIAAWEPATARVLFRAEALPPAERDRIAPHVTAAGPLARLELPAAELDALAADAPGLACLRAAHLAATSPPGPPRLMGIVNVTPDSFSDGGRHLAPERAIEHGIGLAAAGAAILDVGGESTRPGALPVDADAELERVLPVVAGLAERTDVPISIDTSKATVAARALDAGASMVNDVSAGRFDPDMPALVAERGCEYVLMHMRGEPRDMQADPHYADCTREVVAELRERVSACLKAGIEPTKILVDPGIGFGKRLEDNLELIRALPELRSLGLPVLLGVSFKSFLGRLTGTEPADRRIGETAAAVTAGVLFGAEVLRVHDVAATATTVRVARAIADPP